MVIPLITLYSHAEIPQGELTEIRNKLCYVDWAVNATSILNGAKDGDFFKPKLSSKTSKYRESIINVIGHAIADCLTMSKEFVLNSKQTRVITFDTDPSLYQRKHWNAVILYNYIDLMLHRDYWQEHDNIERFELIKNRVKEHYKNAEIPDLEQKLKTSVNDIKKYRDKLNLDQYLDDIEKIIIQNPDLEDRITTLNFDMQLKDLNKGYDQNKEIIFKMNNCIDQKTNCYVDLGNGANADFKKVELKYDPKESEGNKWSLVDNGYLEINSRGKQYKGYYKHVSSCFTIFWQRLMQFVDCDLELDITELQDYHIWSQNCYTTNFYGKKSGLIEVLNGENNKDEQYMLLSKNERMATWESKEDRYISYRNMNPKDRPFALEE